MTSPEKPFQGLNVGVYVMDEVGRITDVNPRTEELLLRPAADLIGADAHDLLHREADGELTPRSACHLLHALLNGETAQSTEAWLARGDGTLLPVGWLAAPYRTVGHGAGAAVFFHERTPKLLGAPSNPGEQNHVGPADRLALTAETTAVLTSTLDVDEALHRLVRLVVPRLADWAVVDLIMDGGELRRVAVVHHEDDTYVNVEELEGPMPPVSESSRMPLSRVLRGAPPVMVSLQEYEEQPDTGVAAVQRDLFLAIGMRSAIMAPLRGSSGVLGALTVARSTKWAPFGSSELSLVEDIARRAGLAVDNAQLYERQRRVSETMQRHLLPPLPHIAGLEMAVRYLPAPHGSQVGGDWYDAFVVPDGAAVLVIGDVVGHDLQAAAGMSQVRNMLRAFAWELGNKPPSRVVDRLDRALPDISDVSMVTLVFARVTGPPGGPWQLAWTNGGHPPPLLVTHDGRARFLDAGPSVLLGTDLWHERGDANVALPPLSTLVLYTDGLVESPEFPLEQGLGRLRRHAASLVRRPLGEFCDQLIERVRPAGNEDDIALLALRTPP